MNHKFVISKKEVENRLDKWLLTKFEEFSRSQIQKWIKNNFVTVNGENIKNGYLLQENDSVLVEVEEISNKTSENLPEAQNIPLDIVYEDSDLIVINKSADMVVHPGAGNEQNTLVNALLFYSKELSDMSGNDRPGIVHRLDKGTSGLLVVAKNNKSHRLLAEQFEKKTATRVYKALCWHPFSEDKFSGIIQTNIGRNPKHRKKQAVLGDAQGKKAITRYKVIEQYPIASFLKFKLDTGRTHQIRVHSSYIKHPVFGDELYSGDDRQVKSVHLHYQKFAKILANKMTRQILHAYKLSFTHPRTNEVLSFESKLPQDFSEALEKLRSKFSEQIQRNE
jgi:23S rRNA pseudouridine1911/1915/1917 synthase